jgi:hypothetical protein
MATGRTPDASETKRPEDSTIAGYDKRGKVRIFRTDSLKDGRLPEGYSKEPPDGTHPNDPRREEKAAEQAADREADLDRRERELAEREAKASGGKQK